MTLKSLQKVSVCLNEYKVIVPNIWAVWVVIFWFLASCMLFLNEFTVLSYDLSSTNLCPNGPLSIIRDLFLTMILALASCFRKLNVLRKISDCFFQEDLHWKLIY